MLIAPIVQFAAFVVDPTPGGGGPSLRTHVYVEHRDQTDQTTRAPL